MTMSVLRALLAFALSMGAPWTLGQQLVVDPGVIIKVGPDDGLALTGPLIAPEGVVLTLLADDSIGGQTGMDPVLRGSPIGLA